MQQEQELNPTSPSDSAVGFPTLKTIWDDQYCQKCNVGNEKGWECLCCGQQFKPVQYTRACAHYSMIPKEGIAVWTAVITEIEFKRYITRSRTELRLCRGLCFLVYVTMRYFTLSTQNYSLFLYNFFEVVMNALWRGVTQECYGWSSHRFVCDQYEVIG
jgi:hypothetical protein